MIIQNRTNEAISEFVNAILEKNFKKVEKSPIIKAIDSILVGDSFSLDSTLGVGTTLYRAREIDVDKAYSDNNCGINAWFDENNKFHCTGYDYYDSKEPPLLVSTQGRNNIAGVSYLYLSGEPYTACAEIKPCIRGLISLAVFKVEKELKILNLYDKVNNCDDYLFMIENEVKLSYVFNYIFGLYPSIRNKKDSYFITQYLSDYIRKAGYDGIKYWGSMNYGTNYTIFNSHRSKLTFVESKIVATAGIEYKFYDIEKKEKLQVSGKLPSIDFDRIQKEISEDIKRKRSVSEN